MLECWRIQFCFRIHWMGSWGVTQPASYLVLVGTMILFCVEGRKMAGMW